MKAVLQHTIPLQDRDIYLLAEDREGRHLYRLNLDNNTMQKVSDTVCYDFILDGNKAYLLGAGNYHNYSSAVDLKSGKTLQSYAYEGQADNRYSLTFFQGKVY